MSASPTITIESPFTPEAAKLLKELDVDLLARYPAQNIHGVALQELEGGQGFFVVARIEGRPVGCGAIRMLEPGVAEVKRMFVRREARRRGVARAVLTMLEEIAQSHGFHALRLETGTRQPEANALYESQGYRQIPCFGEYVSDPFSVCYEKAFERTDPPVS